MLDNERCVEATLAAELLVAYVAGVNDCLLAFSAQERRRVLGTATALDGIPELLADGDPAEAQAH